MISPDHKAGYFWGGYPDVSQIALSTEALVFPIRVPGVVPESTVLGDNKTQKKNLASVVVTKKGFFSSTWNPKQPYINGCFNCMIPNLYIGNGCFTKHPFIYGCLGFQVYMNLPVSI